MALSPPDQRRWKRYQAKYQRRIKRCRRQRPVTQSPAKRKWRVKLLSTIGTVLLFLFTSVPFTSFILEEAMQTCMFGSFAINKAKGKAKDPVHAQVVYDNCQIVHDWSYQFLHTVGWINPFNYAYVLYLRSDSAYWYAFSKNQGIENDNNPRDNTP